LKVILSIDPIKYPLTGIGRYTYELAKALGLNDQVESLHFLGGRRLCNTIPEPSEVPDAMLEGRRLRHLLLKSRTVGELYRVISPHLKARALRGMEDHIFHGPNFYLPPFEGTSVVTIHDLSPYLWAECHPPERIRYMLPEIELSLKRAAVLITDSEFTRQEVAKYFSWPIEKVHAVNLASAATFHPRAPSVLAPKLKGYGLTPGGYCLFAGTIEPRKNIDTLLDAYAMLPAAVRLKYPLVLTGYQGWNSEALHDRMTHIGRAGWARYLGFVSADKLPMLFAGARLFAFPSFYEGFGLPVLEAMASGVPVVCSNASSLPEVAGNAAAMCHASDVNTLTRLILAGLEDESWRRDATKKGLYQAAKFTWQRCAKETITAYQVALST
jgi:glycosyltransferase involved in cell wall biosynthesis